MFIGHFAAGYAAKRWAPRLSLAVLFAAAQLADLLWPVLVAAGVERVRIAPGFTASTPLEFISYPYSHSLLTLVLWGALFGWIVARRSARPAASAFARARSDRELRRDRSAPTAPNAPSAPSAPDAPTAPVLPVALLILALVISHWLFDFITHIPDMPLYPGGPKFGVGLWNSAIATKVVEVAMFAAGVWIYMRATAARDRIGRWGAWALAAFLLVGFTMSGAPPPSVTALWAAAIVLGGLTLWLAWWTDRHRASG